MNTREQVIFLTVAECGSYTKAAELLKTSPPTVLRAIRSLEKECGAELLTKDGHPITLTAVGAKLKHMLDSGMSTEQKLRRFIKEQGTKIIKIGFAFPASWSLVSDKISAVKREHPDICIHPLYGDKHMIREMMIEQEIDFAVFPDRFCLNSYRQIRVIERYEWGLCGSSGIPLVNKRFVELSDISNLPLILPTEESSLTAIAKWMEDDKLIDYSDSYNCTQILIDMLLDDYGFAFVPKAYQRFLERNTITYYRCTPSICTSLYLYSKMDENISYAASLLLDAILRESD